MPLPLKAENDAFHIAIATVHHCQYLLTCNCRHIADAELQRKLQRIARDHGLTLPVICTPEDLMGE